MGTRATELETCGTCHLQKRAAQMRSSHMPLREGKMSCTSCHNPHGTVTPALLREDSLNAVRIERRLKKKQPGETASSPAHRASLMPQDSACARPGKSRDLCTASSLRGRRQTTQP